MNSSFPSSNGLGQMVYDTLGQYLRRDPKTLQPEDSLRDDLGLDSLQTIELIYEVESAFDLQIPDEDFGRLTTIGEVVIYLTERTRSPNYSSPPAAPMANHVQSNGVPGPISPIRDSSRRS